jgi:hypothetical protein
MTDHATAAHQATARPDANTLDANTLFASLELSKTRWLVTVSARAARSCRSMSSRAAMAARCWSFWDACKRGRNGASARACAST